MRHAHPCPSPPRRCRAVRRHRIGHPAAPDRACPGRRPRPHAPGSGRHGRLQLRRAEESCRAPAGKGRLHRQADRVQRLHPAQSGTGRRLAGCQPVPAHHLPEAFCRGPQAGPRGAGTQHHGPHGHLLGKGGQVFRREGRGQRDPAQRPCQPGTCPAASGPAGAHHAEGRHRPAACGHPGCGREPQEAALRAGGSRPAAPHRG